MGNQTIKHAKDFSGSNFGFCWGIFTHNLYFLAQTNHSCGKWIEGFGIFSAMRIASSAGHTSGEHVDNNIKFVVVDYPNLTIHVNFRSAIFFTLQWNEFD